MTLQLYPTQPIVYHPTLTLTPTQPLSQIYTVSPICTMCLVVSLGFTLATVTVSRNPLVMFIGRRVTLILT